MVNLLNFNNISFLGTYCLSVNCNSKLISMNIVNNNNSTTQLQKNNTKQASYKKTPPYRTTKKQTR